MNKLNPQDLYKRQELAETRENIELIELDLAKQRKELNKVWRLWRNSIKHKYKLADNDTITDDGEIKRAEG